jgi:hypothetical protein
MTYRINKTDGNQLTDIPDGTFDTSSTSLTLIGRNVTAFGEAYNENLIKLLENFASASAPESALKGQLWYDTSSGRLNVYDGTDFRAAGGPIISSREPTNLVGGDLWINSETNQLWFYDGTDLVLAGPIYNSIQGTTGFVVETVLDNFNRGHTIAKLYVSSTLLGLFSKDEFTPAQPIVGYAEDIKLIKVGFNAGSLTDMKFDVIVTRAENILTNVGDLKSAEQIVYNDEDQVIVGSLTLQSDTGLIIGSSEDVDLKIDNGKFVIEHKLTGQNVGIKIKSPTGTIEALTVDSVLSRIGIFQENPQATLDVNGNVKIAGDLTVAGQTIIIQATEVEIEDKNIVLGKTLSIPTDLAADGGGITLKGTTDKTIIYNQSSESWSSNISWNVAAGETYKIDNTDVLSNNTLGAGVVNSNLQTLGTLESLNVDNLLYINNTTVSTSSGNLIFNPNQNIDVSAKRITNLQDAVDVQDATSKSYVDARVFDRGIAISMDITGLSNNQIASILDAIAPFYDPVLAPEGMAIDGTRCRLHGTTLSASVGDLTYSPSVATGEFTTVSVRNAANTGTETVVQGMALGQTIQGPSATINVLRQDKLFVMGGGLSPQSGQWGFESDINAPYTTP